MWYSGVRVLVAEITVGHGFWPVTHVTHQSIDPWAATRVSRLLTSHDSRLLQFPVRTTKWSALKIKHHHYHKILRRGGGVETTELNWRCGLSCAISLYNVWRKRNHGSTGHKYWPVTTWPTQICWPTWPVTRDPLTRCHLWLLANLTYTLQMITYNYVPYVR